MCRTINLLYKARKSPLPKRTTGYLEAIQKLTTYVSKN